MTNITEQLDSAIKSLLSYENKSQRPPNSVQLIAVSKTKPVSDIQQAINAGQKHFGENYVQEGVDKVEYFKNTPLTWHFIGPIQSNKTKLVAASFDWVHTIDRLKVAKRLNEQRGCSRAPIQVLIQVNISGEDNKSGVALKDAFELATQIQQFDRLNLRGLMTIGVKTDDDSVISTQFNQMNQLFEQLKSEFDTVDTLSMGMSSDLELAIENGSTMVRIGSAIFGSRNTYP